MVKFVIVTSLYLYINDCPIKNRQPLSTDAKSFQCSKIPRSLRVEAVVAVVRHGECKDRLSAAQLRYPYVTELILDYIWSLEKHS